MSYFFIKWLLRPALRIFFRNIIFENRNLLDEKGPLLLACNHPNSFLDALIIGCHFREPVHFLARGDAFKKPVVKKVLTALKVIPIYRLSEGKEYLALNDTTFERCTEILEKGGIVLIFSEGLCMNQWKLRPLKKGTARIALNAWQHTGLSNSFRILPVSFNYSSFTRFRKTLIIHFGEEIIQTDFVVPKPDGEVIAEINKTIYARLQKGIITEENDENTVAFLLSNFAGLTRTEKPLIQFLKEKQVAFKTRFDGHFEKLKGTKRVVLNGSGLLIRFALIFALLIPAFCSLLVHLPLFFPLNNFIKKKTKGTVFYHSALFVALVLSYPLYALIVSVGLIIITSNFIFLSMLLVMPFFAFIILVWTDCCEEVINFYLLPSSIRKSIKKSIENDIRIN